jgi:hypothetical protein
MVNVALLADNGDDASATEVGLEDSSLAKDIQCVTNIFLSALEEKVNKFDFVRVTYYVFPHEPSTLILYEELVRNNDIFEIFGFSLKTWRHLHNFRDHAILRQQQQELQRTLHL